MICADIVPEDWVRQRFEGRCYFYPQRDCPGWKPDSVCGRIGQLIPEDAEKGP